MNKIEKYEYMRSLSEEDFALLKEVYNNCKLGIKEKITSFGKFVVVIILAYIGYAEYGIDNTISTLGWISSAVTAFGNEFLRFIFSLIGAIKISNKPKEYRKAYMEKCINMISEAKKKNFNKINEYVGD